MLLSFVDREDELKGLNNIYKSKGPDLFILYGRRRIGKTELIKKFIKNKPSFYFLAKKQDISLEIERLRKEYSETHNVYIPEQNTLEKTIKTITQKTNQKEKFVFIIDEFPYWIEENKGILSDIQHLWDEHLEEKNIFLVLMGSSVGTMESNVLDYKSPLYGRRTGQLQLKELPIKSMKEFLPNYTFKDLLRTYGAIGSIPYYLKEFDPNKDFMENIDKTFLNKLNILYEEAEILLREELRKPNTYFNITKSILDGATTLNEISNQTKVSITNLNKYLKVLTRLNIIEKEYPITEPAKQKNFIYKIKDNYFRFWLKYVYPNQSRIEENPKTILNQIKQDYNQYMGPIFEEICRKIPKEYEKIGKWWYKENEIDLVALNQNKSKILLGECKWSNKKIGSKLLKKLERKAEKVRWGDDDRSEEYAIFSKSGFKTRIMEIAEDRDDVELYDLSKIKKELQPPSL